MANETYIKPFDVSCCDVNLKKVDEISAAELGDAEALYGDNAVWPTGNKTHNRNARVTIRTRDHAGYMALLINTKGTLSFSFEDEEGNAVPVSWPNWIVKDRQGTWGRKPNAGSIILEVEDATGLAGPWS